MRSYSTLLAHILGSHDQISGYAESNLSYRGPLDLFKLRCVTCMHGNFKKDCVYVMDKIIGNSVEISDAIRANRDINFLFLIRRPAETLKSIINILRLEAKKEGRFPDDDSLAETAVGRYGLHLNSLSENARRFERLGRQPVWLEAERIVEDTATVLRQLENYLQLRSKLDQSYSVFSYTGTHFKGDVSTYIRSGSIQRERDSYAEIELPPSCVERAELEFERCRDVLKETCVPLERSTRDSVAAVGLEAVSSNRLSTELPRV
jgi:hypothetical protein